MKHGEPATEVDLAVFLGDDPDLAMVTADPVAWMAAHPCECEGLCVCDAENEKP